MDDDFGSENGNDNGKCLVKLFSWILYSFAIAYTISWCYITPRPFHQAIYFVLILEAELLERLLYTLTLPDDVSDEGELPIEKKSKLLDRKKAKTALVFLLYLVTCFFFSFCFGQLIAFTCF